nr:uncharacterized protein CFP56_12188 [Quercus suber]
MGCTYSTHRNLRDAADTRRSYRSQYHCKTHIASGIAICIRLYACDRRYELVVAGSLLFLLLLHQSYAFNLALIPAMPNFTLPDKDSSGIHLEVGTADEAVAQTNANSTEWRGALSREAYLRREEFLSQQDLTQDGGLTPWMLVHQPSGRAERHVLCGCETIKKKAIVAKNGVLRDVVAHAVGSVFCPPNARGRGYAGRMMTELGKKLRQWQVEEGQDAAFSVLFSDIGKAFSSAHVSLPPTSKISANAIFAQKLQSEQLPALCRLDEQLIRQRLSSTAALERTTVALIPDTRVMAWHHARESFVANELYKKTPVDRGAIVGEPGSRVWCYWMRVWGNPENKTPNTMHIMRLVVEDDKFSDFSPATEDGVAAVKDSKVVEHIAMLLATAQAIASLWDMQEVMIWNPTSATVAAARRCEPGTSVVHREDESITSLLWYGEGRWEDVDWVCNEKYSWC